MSMVGFNSHALQILVSNSCFHTWLQYLFSVLVSHTCVNTLCQYYRYADLLSPLWTGVAKPAILIIIDELCRSGFDRIVVVSYTPNTQVLNPIQSLTTLPFVLCSLSALSGRARERPCTLPSFVQGTLDPPKLPPFDRGTGTNTSSFGDDSILTVVHCRYSLLHF